MTVDFAISCSLVRPGRPRYPVLVHQAAVLLHAFFRPHLAMTPLRFANPSPSSGWIEDFHLQAVVHTRHTAKSPALRPGLYGNALASRLLRGRFGDIGLERLVGLLGEAGVQFADLGRLRHEVLV